MSDNTFEAALEAAAQESTIEQEIKLGRASYHRDSLDNQVSQKILQPSYRF